MKIKHLIILTILFGCNFFSTREPELPTSTSTSQIPATTPEILFRNFKSSIEQKAIDNYILCFVDQAFLNKKFKFIASANSLVQNPTLNDWGIESERQYFNNLKSISLEGNSLNLTLNNLINTSFGDSAIYQYDYEFNVNTKDISVTGTYKGTTQFKINLDKRNQWVITSWQDISKDNSKTWSDLKGRLY
ncbi:MAG: hypothetical protein N2321_04730 [Melioribacteraceae bacterium]|nr:hypothetical protein [Melioribacteraceae bacterium]